MKLSNHMRVSSKHVEFHHGNQLVNKHPIGHDHSITYIIKCIPSNDLVKSEVLVCRSSVRLPSGLFFFEK